MGEEADSEEVTAPSHHAEPSSTVEQRGLSNEVLQKALKGVGLATHVLPPLPGQGATTPTSEILSSSAISGGHTPESIARLPPKLRARLVQRGILKEEDVRIALAIVASPSPLAAEPKASPGTPPDLPEAPLPPIPATTLVLKEPLPLPTPVAPVQVDMVAPQVPLHSPQQLPPLQAQMVFAQVPPMVEMPAMGSLLKAPQAPHMPAAPTQIVYSSAPVLSNGPSKRKEADVTEEESLPKRQCPEAQVFECSPADARAAMARAEGEKAPVWLYKNGEVSQAGQQPTQPVAEEPAVLEAEDRKSVV